MFFISVCMTTAIVKTENDTTAMLFTIFRLKNWYRSFISNQKTTLRGDRLRYKRETGANPVRSRRCNPPLIQRIRAVSALVGHCYEES